MIPFVIQWIPGLVNCINTAHEVLDDDNDEAHDEVLDDGLWLLQRVVQILTLVYQHVVRVLVPVKML